MALRHEFPKCSLAEVSWDQEKRDPVRAQRAPFGVGFRHGADLAGVVDAVKQYPNVSIEAACGSGKSVRVPLHLAAELSKLVVHSVPSRLLASSLGEYVASTTSQTVTVVEDVDSDFPTRGVALISNAVLVARFLSNRLAFKKPFVLFMDESHESDCFTAVLRKLGTSLKVVERFLTATATAGPSGFRKKETPGQVFFKQYEDEPAHEWDVEGTGKPWSVNQLDGPIMIAVEQAKAVQHLQKAFTENGCDVYVLNSRSSNEERAQAFSAVANAHIGIVVLLVDYSFRSGFTAPPMTRYIDTGRVMYGDVDPQGGPLKRMRLAYKFELEQFGGRAARTPGSVATVYQPKLQHEAKICDMEGVEVDAAVLLYRMFGFRPPTELKFSPFYEGKVPKNMLEALRSPIPLRCIPANQLVDWTESSVQGTAPPIVDDDQARPPSPRYRRVIIPPTPRLASSRESSPSPTFNQDDSVTQVPPTVLEGLSELHADPGPNRDGLFRAEEPETSPMSPESVLGYYGGFASRRDSSVGSKRSGMHSRVASVSSATSTSTVELEGDSFEDEFRNVMRKVQVMDGSVEPGRHYYYNAVAEGAPETTIAFPAGLESVLAFMAKDDSHLWMASMKKTDRAYALSVLLDGYNESLAEMRAIHRLGKSFSSFAETNEGTVRKQALKDWVLGLAEIFNQRSMMARTMANAMCQVVDHGFEPMDSLESMEDKFIEMHAQDLGMATEVRKPEGLNSYKERLAAKAVNQSVNRSTTKMLTDANRQGETSNVQVPRSAIARPRITAGQVRTRDMLGRAGGVELGRVKYKLEPSSGIGHLWARPLMKLIGKGEMRIELD